MKMELLIYISGAGHINALKFTNSRSAQCADCTVGLTVNKGLLWFPSIYFGDIPPGRKYICLNCAIKRVKKAKYRFSVGLVTTNTLEFNSIFLQYGGAPGILVGPDAVINALGGDATELRKAFRLANYPKNIRLFQSVAKRFCNRWFNTRNHLTWYVRGAMWRGSTARFFYRRVIVECLRPVFGLLSL